MTRTTGDAHGHALPDLIVRRSAPADLAALARLAQLDGAPPPTGDHLVAEEGRELRAALPLGSGRVIADPFHPTAHLVGMLELRAAALGKRDAAPLRGRGLRARLRLERRTPAGLPSRAGLTPHPSRPLSA
jgi:hypothetical protein